MADVVSRTGSPLQYLKSVHTPDFPIGQWIHNPDLSALTGVPVRYWKVSGDIVSEMGAGEKAAVDAAALQAERDNDKVPLDDERLIQALALTIMDEINILRAEHSLPDRTISQLKTAIKNRVDTL
jgi:hypothetical protein